MNIEASLVDQWIQDLLEISRTSHVERRVSLEELEDVFQIIDVGSIVFELRSLCYFHFLLKVLSHLIYASPNQDFYHPHRPISHDRKSPLEPDSPIFPSQSLEQNLIKPLTYEWIDFPLPLGSGCVRWSRSSTSEDRHRGRLTVFPSENRDFWLRRSAFCPPRRCNPQGAGFLRWRPRLIWRGILREGETLGKNAF